MAPSRRRVLRLAGLSAAGLAGCLGDTGTPTAEHTPTARSTPVHTPTASPTETPTDSPTDDRETRTAVDCEDGQSPSGWPLPAHDAGGTNHHPDAAGPTRSPATRWAVTADPPETGEVRYTRPVVADGTVYVGRQVVVGTHQRPPDVQHVRAFDAACGEVRWRAPVAGRPETPMVVEDAVVVHDEATIYALDARTGERRWTHERTGDVVDAVPAGDGILVASSTGGEYDELRALAPDGSVRWRLSVRARVPSDLAWAGGRAYLVTADAVLMAVDTAEQSVAWTLDLQDDEDTVPASVTATPGAVFPVVDGVAHAVTPRGDLVWTNGGGVRTVATDGDTVYGVDGDGHVRALDADDGTERWHRFHGRRADEYVDGFYADPALGGGTLYAGTLDGTLLALSAADGSERWRIARDWEGDAAVALADRTLFVAWANRLLALQ